MKKLFYIAIFFPVFLQAQGNNSDLAENISLKNASERIKTNANEVSSENKEHFCKECEEIKKLKKQQIAKHFYSKASKRQYKKHYFRHFYFLTSKKVSKMFGVHKKKKMDYNYSCFVW